MKASESWFLGSCSSALHRFPAGTKKGPICRSDDFHAILSLWNDRKFVKPVAAWICALSFGLKRQKSVFYDSCVQWLACRHSSNRQRRQCNQRVIPWKLENYRIEPAMSEPPWFDVLRRIIRNLQAHPSIKMWSLSLKLLSNRCFFCMPSPRHPNH